MKMFKRPVNQNLIDSLNESGERIKAEAARQLAILKATGKWRCYWRDGKINDKNVLTHH
jgi:muconolactone delta-isomerase